MPEIQQEPKKLAELQLEIRNFCGNFNARNKVNKWDFSINLNARHVYGMTHFHLTVNTGKLVKKKVHARLLDTLEQRFCYFTRKKCNFNSASSSCLKRFFPCKIVHKTAMKPFIRFVLKASNVKLSFKEVQKLHFLYKDQSFILCVRVKNRMMLFLPTNLIFKLGQKSQFSS